MKNTKEKRLRQLKKEHEKKKQKAEKERTEKETKIPTVFMRIGNTRNCKNFLILGDEKTN